MKKNLLIAAAIKAILSGCGGGDEEGSEKTQSVEKIVGSNGSVEGKVQSNKQTLTVPHLRPQGEPVILPVATVQQSAPNIHPQIEPTPKFIPEYIAPTETPVATAQVDAPAPDVRLEAPVVKLATPVLSETPNLRPQGEPVNGVHNQVVLQKSKYASLLADMDRTNSDSLVNQQFRQQYQEAARQRNNAEAVDNQLTLQESKYASLALDKAVGPTLSPQVKPKLATPVLSETPNLRPQGEPVNGVHNQVVLQKSKYASLLADMDRTNSDSLVNQQFRQQYQEAARQRNNAEAVDNQLTLQESKYASLALDKAVGPTLSPQVKPKLATPVLSETPNLRPQGEPGAPLISGESRKERKQPLAKPDMLDNNRSPSQTEWKSRGVPEQNVIFSEPSPKQITIDSVDEGKQFTLPTTVTTVDDYVAVERDGYLSPNAPTEPPKNTVNYGTQTDRAYAQYIDNIQSELALEEAKARSEKLVERENAEAQEQMAQITAKKMDESDAITADGERAYEKFLQEINKSDAVDESGSFQDSLDSLTYTESKEMEHQALVDSYAEHEDFLDAKNPDDSSLIDNSFEPEDITITPMPSVATAPVITEEVIIEQSALLTHVCITKPVTAADLNDPDTEVQVAAFAFSQAQKQLSDSLAAEGYTQQQYTVRTENGTYVGMYFVHINEAAGTSYELTFTPPKVSNINIEDRQVIIDENNNIVFLDGNDDVLATFKIDTSADCDNQ
ncbi:hypothetical protein ACGRL8_17750 [Vibrio rumoiensis]|uniref:hypothetical protein n=1 Tax=Vibrio rumoiensis TaxID=76258 RepID=UPI00374850D5